MREQFSEYSISILSDTDAWQVGYLGRKAQLMLLDMHHLPTDVLQCPIYNIKTLNNKHYKIIKH